jgi:hypothetical protein
MHRESVRPANPVLPTRANRSELSLSFLGLEASLVLVE